MGGVRGGSYNSATSPFQLSSTAFQLGKILRGTFTPTLCLCQEQTIIDMFDAFALIYTNKTHFKNEKFSPGFTLKARVFETRKIAH